MRKQIDFPPYTEAEIKRIEEDGSALCDLFGAGYSDTDISFPADSPYLNLTEEEKAQIEAEAQARETEPITLNLNEDENVR